MKKSCTYCANGNGETRDHIPPKGFFQKKHPKNPQLITVPCCENCREKDQQHDDFIRNLFCSFWDTEAHPVVETDVAHRRNRSFLCDRTLAQQQGDILVLVDRHTPSGIYVGTELFYDLDKPIIDRFIERTCRAVLFDAFKLSYFSARFEWQKNPSMPQNIPTSFKQRNILDVFHYLAIPTSKNENYWVILTFYKGFRIWGKFETMAKIID